MVVGEDDVVLVKVGNSEAYHKQVKEAEKKTRKAERKTVRTSL